MVNLQFWRNTQSKTEIITHSRGYQAGGFRLGQSFNSSLIDSASRRDDVCYFWTTSIVRKAMTDGFKILDKDDKEVLEEFHNLNWLESIIRGVVMERKDGAVTFSIFDNDDLIPFRERNVKFAIDAKGNFTGFNLTEKIGGGHQDIPHPIDSSGLDNVFHIVLRPVDYKYQGTSVLEPIWDLANSRAIIIQSAAILTARVASGIRKATVHKRDDGGDDDQAVDNIEMGLYGLESDDTSIVLRSGYTSEGHKWEDTLEVDTGSGQFNFEDKIKIVHSGLSIATGIPKNYWDGMFFGSLYAADSILRMLHSCLKGIQDSWTHNIEKMIKQWCVNNQKDWKEDYHLEWNLEPKKTEKEEAEINDLKARTDATLKNSGILDNDEIRDERGLKKKKITKPDDFKIKVDIPKEEEEE